jgi:hypothetical protein
MSIENIQRDFGRMESDVISIRRDVNEIRDSIKQINEVLQQQKGGVKVLVLLCTLAGAFGATIVKFLILLSK